jgi:hypothetical protein
MKDKKRALICIGDRPRDENALLFTRRITQAFDLHPILLHVTQPGSSAQECDRLLQSAQEILKLETAERKCLDGVARREIAKELKLHDYHLVVV